VGDLSHTLARRAYSSSEILVQTTGLLDIVHVGTPIGVGAPAEYEEIISEEYWSVFFIIKNKSAGTAPWIWQVHSVDDDYT